MLPFLWLKIWAPTISAIHWEKPDFRLSFLASTKVTTGASIRSCLLERLIIKSQKPFKPSSGLTLNSIPEKILIWLFSCFLISTKIGATINSERAFSEPIATAKGI